MLALLRVGKDGRKGGKGGARGKKLRKMQRCLRQRKWIKRGCLGKLKLYRMSKEEEGREVHEEEDRQGCLQKISGDQGQLLEYFNSVLNK